MLSPAITRLIALTQAAGLTAEKAGWTSGDVFHVAGPMPGDIRAAGLADKSLEYFTSPGTPHNAADEGFNDPEARQAIAFLLESQ